MDTTIGIVAFDGMEELDAIGPWEVFTMAEFKVVMISETGAKVRCTKGLSIDVDHDFGSAPELDVILIPGGDGRKREMNNSNMLNWVKLQAQTCTWVTSVCTGAFIYAHAGLTADRRVTTHWGAIEELRATGLCGDVIEDLRYVRDGGLVTAAGVSAGIDMSLWLVGQITSPEQARQTQRWMQYDPAPPYTAEV